MVHFAGHRAVLIRLPHVTGALREAITDGWLARAARDFLVG
jgi:hypothetical protein